MNVLSDSGFEIVHDVLSAPDCRRLLDALSSPAVPGTRAGARHLLQVPPIGELARARHRARRRVTRPATILLRRERKFF